MYSVICDGPRRFMSSVCLDCASGASPAADTRISKRGSLVLIGNSCKNRPGSGRILLAPDQLRQFRTNVQVSRARSAAASGRHLWDVQMRAQVGGRQSRRVVFQPPRSLPSASCCNRGQTRRRTPALPNGLGEFRCAPLFFLFFLFFFYFLGLFLFFFFRAFG